MPTFTREEIVAAFAAGAAKPMFLRDALRMKRERGDNDCENFKTIAMDFRYGANATVEGAAHSMRQWVRKPHASPKYQAMREAFLADLEAILNGTFTTDKNQKLAA